MNGTRVIAAAALLGVFAATILTTSLSSAPRLLVRDEVFYALTADSLVTTGRDTFGVRWPVYFKMDQTKYDSSMWFQPLLMYAIAADIKLLQFSEVAIRLPTALLGIASVLLLYFVALEMFRDEGLAVLAALLFATSPAVLIHGRVAMDYSAPVPFALGWLLAVLKYLRQPRARVMVLAGLALGIGLFSYFAAYALMPLYAAVTTAILVRRREAAQHALLLWIAFLTPLLFAAPFAFEHPAMMHDVALRLRRVQPPGAAADAGLLTLARLTHAPAAYASFLNPRVLFVDGPERSVAPAWAFGVFPLALAGPLVIGIGRAVRHWSEPHVMLILACMLTAPIPAVIGGENEAIRRALEMVPFAVLLGVYGLETAWHRHDAFGPRATLLLVWISIAAIALVYHDELIKAQAFVRAAIVPCAALAFCSLPDPRRWDRPQLRSVVARAAATLVVIALSYRVIPFGATLITAALAAAAIIAVAVPSSKVGVGGSAVLVSALCIHAVFVYVDFPVVRLGPVPPAVWLAALRLLTASIALAAIVAIVRVGAVEGAYRPSVWGVAAALAILEAIAFWLDSATLPAVRSVQVIVLLAGVAGVSMALRSLPEPGRIRSVCAATIVAVTVIQFGYVARDYFTDYQVRGSSAVDGKVADAFVHSLDRIDSSDVAAVYLATGRHDETLVTDYWAFYARKRGRLDLLPKTRLVDATAVSTEWLEALPASSMVIAARSANTDRAVASWQHDRASDCCEPVSAADGVGTFWILEKR